MLKGVCSPPVRIALRALWCIPYLIHALKACIFASLARYRDAPCAVSAPQHRANSVQLLTLTTAALCFLPTRQDSFRTHTRPKNPDALVSEHVAAIRENPLLAVATLTLGTD